MRQYGKMWNSPENKRKRSESASRAAKIRWSSYHSSLDEGPPRKDPPEDVFRVTVENLITGESNILLFHPGDRSGRYKIDVNGKPWQTCGWTAALAKVRKSCVRLASDY